MKKLVLLTILLCLPSFGVLAQKRPTPDKSNKSTQTSDKTSKLKQAQTLDKTGKINQAQKTDKNNQSKQTLDKKSKPKQTQTVDKASKTKQIQKPVKADKSKQPQAPILTKISETEWKNLIDALKTEDWGKSASFSSQLLSRIKTDDEEKRLAQLRYFYLFALAGKIFQFSSAGEQVKEAEVWEDLEKAVSNFIGKEFVLPPRRFLGDCSQVQNYICKVKDNEKALRVTATNSEGTAIHSFEYVLFEQKIDLKEFTSKETFLGGKLKRVEFNNDLTKPWIMRLFFKDGFVRVILAE
jgi:hypothetical protein